jgi:hypothetical protein
MSSKCSNLLDFFFITSVLETDILPSILFFDIYFYYLPCIIEK